MDARSIFEMDKRDEIARISEQQSTDAYESTDDTEVSSTLRRLGRLPGKCILELGCGTGRFTRKLIKGGGTVVAIDFSRDSLSASAKGLPDSESAGFIHADVSKISVKENSFDLALSTLYSNIPDPEARLASTKIVHYALKPGGKYVLSAHHYEIRDAIKGNSPSGAYDNGIFFQKFTEASIRKELSDVFPMIKTETICIWLPYLSRIASIRSLLSIASESVPLLNRLGSLLLVTCTKS
jgi:ubiquinone/menaquinone biosynthesis C-methylase UbiE